MTDQMKRLVADTANTLQLSSDLTEYLRSCLEIAYTYGQRDQLVEDHADEMKRFDELKRNLAKI